MTSAWRVRLARELTARARMPAQDALRLSLPEGNARRVGITGPPGAGKSTLIGLLVEQSIAAGSKVGVLAVDPTSPISGGSLLGDRVRMDHISGGELAFIRSVASGAAVDGLCPNIAPLLSAFDEEGFDELVLETVGIGQVSYTARHLVDTFVLVLVPESGDTVQAMKAGIIETADIIVVNKADRPGASKLVSELRSIGKWQSRSDDWKPVILPMCAAQNEGIGELRNAIELHFSHFDSPDHRQHVDRARRRFHLRSTIQLRVDEIMRGWAVQDEDVALLYNDIIKGLAVVGVPGGSSREQ